MVKLYYKKLYL